MADFDEKDNEGSGLPNSQKFGQLREALMHLISSVDPTIDWSKVGWEQEAGAGYGSCKSDDPETTQKLQAAFFKLKSDAGQTE
ncbi:hypothetical protein GCM10027299_00650 [Larkinella ripae]